jgi:hypothetical protein
MIPKGWKQIGLLIPDDLLRQMDRVAPPERAGRRASEDGRGRSAFIRRAVRAELDRIENAPCKVCGRARVPTLYGAVVCPDDSDEHAEREHLARHPEAVNAAPGS